MFSFEGDFKTRPKVSLGGASRKVRAACERQCRGAGRGQPRTPGGTAGWGPARVREGSIPAEGRARGRAAGSPAPTAHSGSGRKADGEKGLCGPESPGSCKDAEGGRPL